MKNPVFHHTIPTCVFERLAERAEGDQNEVQGVVARLMMRIGVDGV